MSDRDIQFHEPILGNCLKSLAEDLHKINRSKGWQVIEPGDWIDDHRLLADLMLATTEVSEAAEAFRKGDIKEYGKELADIVIRVVGHAHGLGIDLGEEILQKVEKNRNREYKHGGKRI